MEFKVLLTNDAACDLEEIYHFIALHDSPQKADYVLARIEKVFSRLSEFPERGVYPKELLALGIREYREVFFETLSHHLPSYEQYHDVLLIVDGRRDMQSLLQPRLLNA